MVSMKVRLGALTAALALGGVVAGSGAASAQPNAFVLCSTQTWGSSAYTNLLGNLLSGDQSVSLVANGRTFATLSPICIYYDAKNGSVQFSVWFQPAAAYLTFPVSERYRLATDAVSQMSQDIATWYGDYRNALVADRYPLVSPESYPDGSLLKQWSILAFTEQTIGTQAWFVIDENGWSSARTAWRYSSWQATYDKADGGVDYGPVDQERLAHDLLYMLDYGQTTIP
jgi:hypothetical protein